MRQKLTCNFVLSLKLHNYNEKSKFLQQAFENITTFGQYTFGWFKRFKWFKKGRRSVTIINLVN